MPCSCQVLTSNDMLPPNPHVVRCTQVRHVWDGALAVDLPHTLQAGLQVGTALRPNVNVVCVKGGPAQSPPPPHL
jgi:hypothetical protein